MKLILKITLVTLGLIAGTYFALRLSGVLQFFEIPNPANVPGIKENSIVFVSKWANVETGDFVTYNNISKEFGHQVRLHRLVGKPGDTVELRSGELWVNGMNYDNTIELSHEYSLETEQFQELLKNGVISDEREGYEVRGKLLVHLEDRIASLHGLANRVYIQPKKNVYNKVKDTYKESWNLDHFGPLIIPEGKYFVIGDNRHNSDDSRTSGLIDESDIIGPVVLIMRK